MAPLLPTDENNAVTLQDIADRCGVSRGTVSRALRGDIRNVNQQTMNRIRATAKEMGYDPSLNLLARRLVHKRTGKRVCNQVLSLIFPEDFQGSPYFTQLFFGILDILPRTDFNLVTSFDASIRKQVPAIFSRGDIDGAIVIGEMSETINKLSSDPGFGDRPVVSLINELPGHSMVVADDRAGGEQAAGHLLDIGHRHILARWDKRVHILRQSGHELAYRNRGLNSTEYLTYLPWDMGDPVETERIVIEALNRHPEITAIIASNDFSAMMIANALERHGIKIPDNISLIGFDDTHALPDANGQNKLTTIRIPLRQIGRCAAQLIIDRIIGKQTSDITLTLPTELVIRGSTRAIAP